MYYYLSIGTNINPEYNAAQIIHLLAQAFHGVSFFPFVYTRPQGMQTRNTFLNSVAVVQSGLGEEKFKQRLNAIETDLGRDRNDPLRSTKDRTADIDILGKTNGLESNFFQGFDESYIRGVVRPHANAIFADLTQFGIPETTKNDITTETTDATTEKRSARNGGHSPMYFSHT